MTEKNDMIVALATPYGRSALAVIRISGKDCIAFVERFLSRALSVGRLKVNRFTYGGFTENLTAIAYRAPNSYSGEDTVELFPHGNPVICDSIIKILTDCGARIAERGEFTKRAFFNGKLDLMQCEALADIIDAQTAEQLDYGNKRFDGGFKELERVQELLKRALSTIEAVLHYSDELEGDEVDEAMLNDVVGAVREAKSALKKEIDAFAGGKIVNEGFKVALIGAPNVGKSTLLNALIGSDRAIVTPIAGTTRDTVDGEYVFCGRKFCITDTAGLNDNTDDRVEKIGMERARAAADGADAVVLVTDGAQPKFDISRFRSVVSVKNKCDGIADCGEDYGSAVHGSMLWISAKKGINVTALKRKLYDMCPKDFGAICNHRQYDCAVRCLDSVVEAEAELGRADGLEIVAAALYEAYSAICELYGENSPDEKVITSVFERFCVGK